jgi:methionyl-tRNA synthetase
MPPYYVTTQIYYVNDLPHIGHIFTTVVADTVARYRRLAGDDVRFLTGTDEHGQKIERAAAGVRRWSSPTRRGRYRALEDARITHDDFIRTTELRHERAVPAILERMTAAGDVYSAKHEGWYCTGCETFYTEKELRQPGNLCPDHGTPTEWKSEENLLPPVAPHRPCSSTPQIPGSSSLRRAGEMPVHRRVADPVSREVTGALPRLGRARRSTSGSTR